MKRKFKVFALIILIWTIGSNTIWAQNTDSTYSPMPVKGARYLGFNHKISYGDFSTNYVWASTVENSSWAPLGTIRYKYISKFKFKQTLGNLTVRAKMKQDLATDEYAILAKVFGNRNIDKGYDYWGYIEDPSNGEWTMVCNTSMSATDFDCGEIFNSTTREAISIYGRNRSTTQDLFMLHPLFAYSFIYHDRVIATIDSEGYGWVWIDSSLQPELQVVVAACISSLLMLKWQLR